MAFALRQGTVYAEKATGRRFILVNHNPMGGCSLRLWSGAPDAPFDLAAPERIGVDELIALRKSGDFDELGDLPEATFQSMAAALLAGGALPPEDAEALKACLAQ